MRAEPSPGSSGRSRPTGRSTGGLYPRGTGLTASSLSILSVLPGTGPPDGDHTQQNPRQARSAGSSNQRVSSQSQITRETHTPRNFPECSRPALVPTVPGIVGQHSFPVGVRRDQDVHEAQAWPRLVRGRQREVRRDTKDK